MKKRLFALLLAVIMIVSNIPLEALAAGYGNVYGTNLGWEYAAISTNSNGGYTLRNPQTSTRYGNYYGDKVHVTYITDGTSVSVVEGSSGVQENVLKSTSTTKIHITCDYGYYISAIVLACAHQSNPFQCQTVATDDAYALAQPGSTLTDVTINMSDVYTWAHHQSSVSTYYLMIELEPIPANVHVGYFSGTAGTTAIQARPVSETGALADGATQVSSYPSWMYNTTGLTSAPTHTALGISPEAEAEANALGYSFAGWKLEYYTTYTSSSNTFSGTMSVGGDKLPQGTSITLTLNAKLTAIWQPLTRISVTKAWVDANNQDGIRPDSITVHLLKNGAHLGSPVTLSSANNWTATWTVPKLDENGNVITYAVEEAIPNGYTCVVTGDATNGFTLTNTHLTERVNVQVQKVWADDNDREGIRPYGVIVQLYKNGAPVDSYTDSSGNVISGTATLTNGTSWTQQWLDLEKNQSGGKGVANTYSVVEIGYVDDKGNTLDNPGYSVSYSTDETGRLVVTNTHEISYVDIDVSKVWNDDNNRDGKRPESVTVMLYANGISTGASAVLNAGNNWSYTWENLYEYYRGSKVEYTVKEDSVPEGYTPAVTGTATTGFTVTNTHVPETVSVPVSKVWSDNEDQDGIRPASITVALYADGVDTGKTLVLSATNGWSGSFEGLEKYKAGSVGTAIVYTVKEVSVPEGYTDSVIGTTITNTHTPETVNLFIRKSWNDGNNQDGNRPYAVVINLWENGQPTEHFITLDGTVDGVETSPWQAVLANMAKNRGGDAIHYTLVETGYYATAEDFANGKLTDGTPPGYTVTHSYDAVTDPKNPVRTVINSYTPAVTALNVQKVWDDNDNQDGKRPASITVTLYRKVGNGEWAVVTDSNGNPVTKVMNPGNEWDVTFTDLPKYQSGQPITYNVAEEAVANYDDPVYDYDPTTGVVSITNTHTPEKTQVSVTKVWNDNNNQDGLRDETKGVVIELYQNSLPTGKTLTLNSTNGWTGTFTDLDKYYHGDEIAYTVVEVEVPTGYTASVTGSAAEGYTVTNTHAPATISVPVSKVWADNNDQDGLRPDSVVVSLYANGVKVRDLTLSAANSWSASFTNLPKFADGEAITYTVQENAVPSGYTAAVTGDAANGYVVTNTHNPAKTSVKVTKVWNDSDNQDGKRPSSITLHLYANGILQPTKTVTIGASQSWSHEWTGLPAFEEGKEINYTVYEVPVGNGYTVSYGRDAEDNVVITNSRPVEHTTFTVQKVWNDTNNQDNIRPYGVAIQLYADGVAYGEPVVLLSKDHWRYTWTGLNVHAAGAEGQDVVYSVQEVYYIDSNNQKVALDAVDYTIGTPVTDANTGIVTITNTHEVEKTDITVTKIWDDSKNQDGIRPESITVNLLCNGEVFKTAELNAANGWSYTWNELDVHHGIGIDNDYAVKEVGYVLNGISYTGIPAGYTDSTNGYTITNTHSIEKISIPVTKVWDDADNQDGKRPVKAVVALYADGVKLYSVDLTADNSWTHVFTDLPKYKEDAVGTLVSYTVQEESVPADYRVEITGDAVTGYTVTNTYKPETANLNVQKVWDDNNNQDGKRPYAVVITLYKNGLPTEYSVVLDGIVDAVETEPWKAAWPNMPRYENGQRISYTVVETSHYHTQADVAANNSCDGLPDGYTVTRSYDTSNTTSPTAIVTNSYTPELTNLNVQKVWDDEDNRDNARPASVTVALYQQVADGAKTAVTDSNGDPVTAVLNPDNEWDVTFIGLPKYAGGKVISYSVEEAPVDGYKTPTYSYNEKAGVVTITNSRDVSRVDISVTKDWNDNDNQDGIRPESVQVTLYANGIRTSETVTLNQDNGWKYTWNDLYEYYHGQKIVYSVVEETVAEGYTAAVTGNEVSGFTVTNTHVPETVSVDVSKVWVDDNDRDGLRPDSISVVLYANGVSDQVITLNHGNNWHYTFQNLPKYADGNLISYTVGEEDVPQAYSTEITGDAANGYVITNSYDPIMTSVKVNKVWVDGDDQDGVRPESITLYLYANGHLLTDKTVTVDAEDGWNHEWTGLYLYEEGKKINYTVYEAAVGNGYSVSYGRDADDNVVITNTRETNKTFRTVQKVWSDLNNQDNIRPYGVKVQLYADNVPYGDPVVLTSASHWRHNWTELPVNNSGTAITYTVKELCYVSATGSEIALEDLDYTTSSNIVDPATGVITLVNTHEVMKTDITVTKVWDDEENRDNIRPDSIRVILYRNGLPFDSADLTAANNWSHTWSDLDVHHGIGVDNVYTVAEADVPDGYTASTEGFVITNSHELMTVSFPFTKVWNDNNDQDGLRPDGIIVALYADGQKISTLTVTAASNWTGSFQDLPKYQEGKQGVAIVYSVKEIGYVDNGTEYNDIPTGYTAEVNGNVITNTHTPETADLNVQKVWDDANNNDGKRPYAVEITLNMNGHPHPTAEKLVLSPANNWKATWENMPRYQNGQRISYSIVETGYYATEEALADGNRTAGVPTGYTVNHSYNTANPSSPVATVTNTYAPETTGINVQKVWDDDSNRDNARPDQITVTLYRKVGNGTWAPVLNSEGNPITAVMNAANEWDVSFTDLPKYLAGQEITYNAVETAVAGYEEAKYDFDPATGVVVITNSRTVSRVNVSVSKVWNDSNNQDGIRPESVQVTLYANGIRTSETVTLNQDNGWKYTWNDLYEYYHGQKILYTVVEEDVADGYTASISGDAATGYTLTNTHVTKTVSIPVTKVWDDNDNQDGIRPKVITVTLLANGEKVAQLPLSAGNSWSGSFGELPAYADGEAIVYTVVETAVEGYEATYSVDDSHDGVLAFHVVNTHIPEKTQLTAIKVWADNNDQDGKRPDSITVHLLADGVHTGDFIVITELMDWTYTWKDLDKYAAGKEIRYTVYEEPVYFGESNAARVIETYAASYVRNPEKPTEITITNVYTPETTEVTALKVWDDDNNRDGLRPESITVELYINGKASGKTLVLNEDNSWMASWTDLPKYQDHGTEIRYSVAETAVPTGYEVTVVEETEYAPGMFILTNTHTSAVTGVSVSKVWNDESDNDGKRPDGIIVQLYANGSALEGAKVVLNDDNRWTYQWQTVDGEPLYVYSQGEEVRYYVDEVGYVIDGKEYEGLPEGYTKETTADSYQVSITNTRATEKTSVTVEKVWEDDNNNDGIRPENVSITLYRNGEALETVTLNEENKWTYTWNGLYKYVAGEEAEYTVEETAVEGYTVSYKETAVEEGISFTVTNTHESAVKELTVSKVWVDENDAEELRPGSVTVQLYANGEAYGDVITLSAANSWKQTVSVSVYAEGKEIEWTVAETKIPRYYSVSYNQDTLTVTNTIQSKDIPKTGDTADMLLWTGMAILLSAGAAIALFLDRKKRYTQA